MNVVIFLALYLKLKYLGFLDFCCLHVSKMRSFHDNDQVKFNVCVPSEQKTEEAEQKPDEQIGESKEEPSSEQKLEQAEPAKSEEQGEDTVDAQKEVAPAEQSEEKPAKQTEGENEGIYILKRHFEKLVSLMLQ